MAMGLKRFWLLVIMLFVFIATKVHAQQTFKLSGVVFERSVKVRVALAEVLNTRTGFAVGTNDMGFFTISAQIGDTLLVTKRNFELLETTVKDTQDLVLYLSKGNVLNEVTIIGQTKKSALTDIKKDFKGKGSFYAGKPPLLSFLFSPLTAFYELFGKTPKQARRFNKMYQNEMQAAHVDQFFNQSLINQQTGLTGKALTDFLIHNRPSFEDAKNWSRYDGIKWISDRYKIYIDTAKVIR